MSSAMIFRQTRPASAGIVPLTFLFFSNSVASGVVLFSWLLGGEGANVNCGANRPIVALFNFESV